MNKKVTIQTQVTIALAAIVLLIVLPEIRNAILLESLAYLMFSLGIIIFAIVLIVSFIVNRQIPQRKIVKSVFIIALLHAIYLFRQSVIYYSTPGLFNGYNDRQAAIANVFAALAGIFYPLAAAKAGILLRKVLKLPQK